MAAWEELSRDQLIESARTLEKELEEIRSVADNSSDYILRYDRSYRHLYANRGAIRDSGLSGTSYLGKTHRDLGYPADLCTLWESKFEQVFRTGEPCTVEFEVPSAVGNIWLEMKLHPEFDPSGEVVTVLAASRDVTKRREDEESLLRLQKLESLGILAGGIAHDFNNILTGILGNLSLATQGTDPGTDMAEDLEACKLACEHATGLTRQLLTFARGGRPVVKVEALEPIVRDAAAFASRGSRSRCEFETAKDLHLAEVDRGQLAQVVQNLVINAIQSMPEGGRITIEMANHELSTDEVPDLGEGAYIGIRVSDEGTGIATELQPKLFDPYFSTKPQGRGLGLATCHSIVQKHGGHLRLASTSESGSVFEVFLPATDKPLPAEPIPASRIGAVSGRVLIMDDDPNVASVLARMLRALGLEPEIVPDGESALTRYRNAMAAGEAFDLVILDLTVPCGMGGKEAMLGLRELDSSARAIVTSGYSVDPVLADFRAHGFLGALPKPFTAEHVSATVAEVLREG